MREIYAIFVTVGWTWTVVFFIVLAIVYVRQRKKGRLDVTPHDKQR